MVGKTLADISTCALCVKVEKIRVLCGGNNVEVSKLREWSVFDEVSVSNYCLKAVPLFEQVRAIVKEHCLVVGYEVFSVVRGMVDLFANGSMTSVASKQIANVQQQLEDVKSIMGSNEEFEGFVSFVLSFLVTCSTSASLTPKSRTDIKSEIVKKLSSLQQNWPLAPLDLLEKTGLNSARVKASVAEEVLRIQKSTDEAINANLVQITKHITKCNTLCLGLNVDNETEFRNAMKSITSKLAGAQTKLKSVCDPVKAAYANRGSCFADLYPTLAREVVITESRCMYYICVYTALSFFRDPSTWSSRDAGKLALKKLKMALVALSSTPGLRDMEARFNHAVVAQMRLELKLPVVPTATDMASGLVQAPASAASASSASNQEASTTSGLVPDAVGTELPASSQPPSQASGPPPTLKLKQKREPSRPARRTRPKMVPTDADANTRPAPDCPDAAVEVQEAGQE
jgi:hypothetical protein